MWPLFLKQDHCGVPTSAGLSGGIFAWAGWTQGHSWSPVSVPSHPIVVPVRETSCGVLSRHSLALTQGLMGNQDAGFSPSPSSLHATGSPHKSSHSSCLHTLVSASSASCGLCAHLDFMAGTCPWAGCCQSVCEAHRISCPSPPAVHKVAWYLLSSLMVVYSMRTGLVPVTPS